MDIIFISAPFVLGGAILTQMTKTQRKRASYDYRTNYFKQNPGLFGKIWFCSQCHKLLFGKRNVQVDHIWALGAGGVNRVFNTVAICARCNRKKSDKTGLYLINGIIGKIIEVLIFRTRDLIKFIPKTLLVILSFLIGLFGWGICIVIVGVVAFTLVKYFGLF